MTYLFIRLNVREGERVHNHKCLLPTPETTEKGIEEAVDYFAQQYWDEDSEWVERDGGWYCFGGEMFISVDAYTTISKEEYDRLYTLFFM